MKEITRIHIARTPYSAEVDAKKALEQYLAAIKVALSADEDAMREIEARIVEILAARGILQEGVVTHKDVEAIEAQLGEPSDFADEDASSDMSDTASTAARRLMRDTSQGVLGGVCAGIADYYGVNVMWPRLVAVLVTLLTSGAGIFIYAAMWLAMPPARTAAEKLQMRGKPVTLAALKSEAGEDDEQVPERSKPFVVLVRVVLGLGFVGAGMMATALLAAVILVRQPLFGYSLHDLASGGGVLTAIGGAYVGVLVAGLLFVLLMGLAAYASFAWNLTKRMVIIGSIVTVLGLVSFGVAVGLGVYGVSQVNQKMDQLKVSDTQALTNLTGVSSATIEDTSSVAVNYVTTSDAPHAVVTHLKGQTTEKVTITQTGNAAEITIKDDGSCGYTAYECTGRSSVTIYGPNLSQLTLSKGSLDYQTAAMNTLATNVGTHAQLTLHGSIASLTANIGDQANLSASDAAVERANVTMSPSASVDFGTIDTVALTAPTACASGDHSTVSAENISNLTINGKSVDATAPRSAYDAIAPCLLLATGQRN